MTGAELKCLRERLGLTAQALADRLDIRHLRTVQRWEAGDVRVPDDVADHLRALDALTARMAAATVDSARDQIRAHGPGGSVTLVRYRSDDEFAARQDARTVAALRTALAHAAVIERTRQALAAAGIRARIVWFDPPGDG